MELLVGERGAELVLHRLAVGGAQRLAFQQLVQAAAGQAGNPRVVPLLQKAVGLVVWQDWELGETAGRVLDGAGQQHLEMLDHALDGAMVEQVRVVAECKADAPVLPLQYGQVEVAVGTSVLDAVDLGFEAGKLRRPGSDVVRAAEDLHQRHAAGGSLRPQRLDHPFEGRILVLERAQEGPCGAHDHVAERRVAGEV